MARIAPRELADAWGLRQKNNLSHVVRFRSKSWFFIKEYSICPIAFCLLGVVS